jgi:uroporphyrinogen-III synthase
VLTVAPYRWELPDDPARVLRLVEGVCAGSIDVVTFTSAPAVDALFAAAGEAGRLDELRTAFRGSVVAAAVGPVTAAPLRAAGIPPIVPERYRMGALIRLVCEHLEEHRTARLDTAYGTVELRGRLVALGGSTAVLAPKSVLLFRTLLAAAGAVVSRADFAAILPDTPDDHAVDVAVSRLRQSLPSPGLVATVIKRGYRIDV